MKSVEGLPSSEVLAGLIGDRIEISDSNSGAIYETMFFPFTYKLWAREK